MNATAQGHVPSSRLDRIGAFVAGAGAVLGVGAGIIELSAGAHIRSWVGNKLDTTRLGLATIVLSLIAVAAAASWRWQPHSTTATKLFRIAGLAVPGLVCFTTVGRLWYVPGALLLAAAGAALIGLWSEASNVRAVFRRAWLGVLTLVLAIVYVFLGATALGVAGTLGILGGIAVVLALANAPRIPRRLRPVVLLVAVVPFALLTWWSVVTPLLAVLILAIGWPALNRPPVSLNDAMEPAERWDPRANLPVSQ